MGEAKSKRTATEKLIAEYPRCCFCAGQRPTTTREHMPPKALFDGSLRPDKLVMPACDVCNNGTKTADAVVSIVSRWTISGETMPNEDHKRLVNGVRKAHPDIVAEWTHLNPLDRELAKHHLIREGIPVPINAGIAAIGPLTSGN